MFVRKKDVLGDYDFSRSDKFYLLRIPTYAIEEGVVLYEMHLKDLTNNETYVCKYRFKDLKAVHETLEKFDTELPLFPRTHFWQKTNSSP
jgi:pullulanase/glycogen debranching enzyme